MEEDIKILKEKIKQWQPYKNRRKFSEIEKEIDIENQAIENILNRLEQLEKENKELQLKIYDLENEIDYLSYGEDL
jgi:predicted  nucleic acid-binding Zn-ribbon protein